MPKSDRLVHYSLRVICLNMLYVFCFIHFNWLFVVVFYGGGCNFPIALTPVNFCTV